MRVQKIDNTRFGQIILDCNKQVPAGLLFNTKNALDKERPGNDFNPFDFLNGDFLPKVIESDYNTPRLMNRYKELVKSQEDNPHNIHIDLFLYDESEVPLYPEGWYQKATVGDKAFPQRLYAFQGSAIKFLEDACEYANKLRRKGAPVVDIPAKDVPISFSYWQLLRTAVQEFLSKH